MKPHKLSSRASEDIQAIIEYIAKDNPEAALRVVDAIEATIHILERDPGTGFKPSYLRKKKYAGVFAKIVTDFKNYLILFEDLGDRLSIIRILHANRNIVAVLDNDEPS